MSKKLIWIVSVVFAVLITFWIWTFASIGSTPIVIGGSTSANSFMQGVITKIKDKDYTYNSTGSQNGINGVFEGVYKAGVLSKVPTFNGSSQWSWYSANGGEEPTVISDGLNGTHDYDEYVASKNSDGQHYSATQLAVDAIVIIYHPPGSNVNVNDSEINFDLSNNVIKNIYEGKTTSWNDISNGKYNGKINAFTRETGSGTKTEFEKKTNIVDSTSANVANSNGMMYSSIEKTEGSIGFVSLPFVRQIAGDSDVFVAGINGTRLGYAKDDEPECAYQFDDASNSWSPLEGGSQSNEDVIGNEYELFRPFVIVYKNKNFDIIKNIFDFLLSDNAKDVYLSEGLVKNVVDLNPKVNLAKN